MTPDNVSTTPDTVLPQDNEANATPSSASEKPIVPATGNTSSPGPEGPKPGATAVTNAIQQEVQGNMGGTTNLDVDQLKKEGDNGTYE